MLESLIKRDSKSDKLSLSTTGMVKPLTLVSKKSKLIRIKRELNP